MRLCRRTVSAISQNLNTDKFTRRPVTHDGTSAPKYFVVWVRRQDQRSCTLQLMHRFIGYVLRFHLVLKAGEVGVWTQGVVVFE